MQAFNCRAKKWEYVEPVPLTDEEIAELQEQADRDVARAKLLERTRPLSFPEVQEMFVRQQINTLPVDDATALRMVSYYPDWTAGTAYAVGYRLVYNGDLYKVLQAHTSQDTWLPGAGTESLYTRIDEQHDGTKYDPIPASRGMEYEYGKYYLDGEDGNTYLCHRTGESAGGTIVLQYMPHELVGQYFEAVTA